MTAFTLVLQDMNQSWRNEQVQSFIATDASGRFGLQAGHEPFVTCLRPGLARFRAADQTWHYIAQPGAVVTFGANQLHLSTTEFMLSDDRDALLQQMDTRWQLLQTELGATRRTVVQVEQALARKLMEMNQRGEHL